MARERRGSTDADAGAVESPAANGQLGRRSRLAARAERQARREELRKQQKGANWRRQWLPWIIAAVLAIAAVAGFLLFVVLPQAQIIAGVDKYTGLSQEHVQGSYDYPQMPPVGGPHSGVWWNCGVYDQPIPKEMAVHSMEHGAVWITYRADLPAADVERLRSLVRGKDYTLLSPWPADTALPSPVVASAWGVQLKADSAADSRLADFVRKYANGNQTPERGATCRGGQGSPLQNP